MTNKFVKDKFIILQRYVFIDIYFCLCYFAGNGAYNHGSNAFITLGLPITSAISLARLDEIDGLSPLVYCRAREALNPFLTKYAVKIFTSFLLKESLMF